MAPDVNRAIAAYLQKIHTKLVFPVVIEKGAKNYRPDRLVLFQEVLMRAYLRSISIFRHPCTADGDCESGKCINGKCGDLVVGPVSLTGIECQADEDCKQTEKCILGECVPKPIETAFGAVEIQPVYGPELKRAFEEYSGRIYQVLTNGLAEQPRKLESVRNVLMQTYAEAAFAGGTPRGKCDEILNCEDGKWCVQGICVEIPFRLVFAGFPPPRPDPWTKS